MTQQYNRSANLPGAMIGKKITRLLQTSDPAAILTAVKLLRQGEAVVFPTDTVYGVGVDPFNAAALEGLYIIKGRSLEKGIPILLADQTDLTKITRSIPVQATRLMERFWPGPLTLIVPRHPDLPAGISPNQNIAVRIPDHPVTRSLIRAAGGAIATTSANLSGRPPATSGQEALTSLGGLVALILDDGPTAGELASTIVDCTASPPIILRYGPLTADELGIAADGC